MAALLHFSGADIRLNREQARRVLKFFFPQTDIDHINVTDEDRSFAQALLIEAIDSSAKIGYVQVVFERLYKPPADFGYIKDLAKDLAKYALLQWFHHATAQDMREPKIYLMVRDRLSVNYRSVWTLRLQTDELTY